MESPAHNQQASGLLLLGESRAVVTHTVHYVCVCVSTQHLLLHTIPPTPADWSNETVRVGEFGDLKYVRMLVNIDRNCDRALSPNMECYERDDLTDALRGGAFGGNKSYRNLLEWAGWQNVGRLRGRDSADAGARVCTEKGLPWGPCNVRHHDCCAGVCKLPTLWCRPCTNTAARLCVGMHMLCWPMFTEDPACLFVLTSAGSVKANQWWAYAIIAPK